MWLDNPMVAWRMDYEGQESAYILQHIFEMSCNRHHIPHHDLSHHHHSKVKNNWIDICSLANPNSMQHQDRIVLQHPEYHYHREEEEHRMVSSPFCSSMVEQVEIRST